MLLHVILRELLKTMFVTYRVLCFNFIQKEKIDSILSHKTKCREKEILY